MSAGATTKVYVGSVEDVRARGRVQVSGGGQGIAVFAHKDRFYALDNRCPHMGGPCSTISPPSMNTSPLAMRAAKFSSWVTMNVSNPR